MPSAACCPCGQLVGCICTALNCATVCERRAGTAELCGFPEFIDPSVPPRFYKRRRTTQAMTTSRYGSPSCGSVVVVSAGMECRTRGGTAFLCGHDEFASPSVPPKKYRSLAFSGGYFFRGYTSSACSAINGITITCNWAGSCLYSKTTCATTNTGTQTCQGSTTPNCVPPGGDDGGRVTVKTPTQQYFTPTGACFNNGSSWGRYEVLSVLSQLSDEDTEQDAIDRLLAATAWSAPVLCSVATSRRATRVDFQFQIVFAATRAVITSGLIATQSYQIKFTIGRRAAGSSGPFVAYGSDIFVSFTATGASFTSDWQELPNDKDFEYQAIGVEVTGAVVQAVIDTWNIDEDFTPNLPLCVPANSDSSTRTVNGSLVGWPFAGTLPAAAYGSQAIPVVSQAERQTVGTAVCAFNSGTGFYEKITGTVLESLSSEDTEQAAIDRALGPATPWLPCITGCALPSCSAFISMRLPGQSVFGFAVVRTKATWTAVIGQTYFVTIRYASRTLGSGGPFIFYALTEVAVLADAVSEETAWFDVPTEPGLEVIVANCSIALL